MDSSKFHTAFSAIVATLATAFLPMAANADDGRNILIDSYEETVTIRPDKSSPLGIKDVHHKIKVTYSAATHDGSALFVLPYSDDNVLGKIKAPDSRTSYGSNMGENVFYSDSKLSVTRFPVKQGKSTTLEADYTLVKPEFFAGLTISEPYDIAKATITYVMPSDMRARFSTDGPKNVTTTDVAESDNGKEYRITYTLGEIPTPHSETYSPGARHLMPQIVWRGTFADQAALYANLRSYLPESDPGAASVSALSAEITAGAATTAEKIDAVNEWVHKNIRYLAVENGELGHRPDLASEVIRKRFGDCKGSANLTKELLRAAGVDSRLVWIGTRSVPYSWSEVPSMSAGNHMIAAAFDGDSLIFLDGTATHCPVGVIPPAIQGREALIEDGDSFILRRVPQPDPADNAYASLDLRYRIVGDAIECDFSDTSRGLFRTDILDMLGSTYADNIGDLTNAYATYGRKGLRASGAAIDHTPDGTTRLTARLSGTGSFKKVGDKCRLSINPDPWLGNLAIDARKRTTPLQIPFRQKRDSRAVLEVPEGYAAEKLPAPVTVDNPWMTGTVDFTTDEAGNIVCSASWTIRETWVPTDDVKAFADSVRSLNKAMSASITLISKE